jgi:hypothetical protein
MFTTTPLNERAAGKSSLGTESGVIACQAGLLTAEPMPRRNVSVSKRPGLMRPVTAITPIAVATMPTNLHRNKQFAAIDDVRERARRQRRQHNRQAAKGLNQRHENRRKRK